MMFPIAREIWKHSRGVSRLKLLAATSISSRPFLKPFPMAFLRGVSESGVFWAEYETAGHWVRASFRLSELSSDICVFREVGIGDCYHIPNGYQPDLVIDAGGNNGMFALSVLKRWPKAKVKIFEPSPDNIERIREHLRENGVGAEVYPYCLGREKGTRKFFCRQAEQGSFFDDRPYSDTMDVQVVQLSEYLEDDPLIRTFIKLDIEGAELEVLEDIFQMPRLNAFIVGELHHHKFVKKDFLSLLDKAHFASRFFDMSDTCAIFHAVPPSIEAEQFVK